MKVSALGGSRTGRVDVVPEDATVYTELGGWRLSASKREKCLIIATVDYHPGLLYLTKEDLERVIEALSD